jgi:hypothetical protein
MSGVGLIMSFNPSTGWRIVSSFPIMLMLERPGGDLKNLRSKAVGFMGDAYKGYANAFVHFLERFNKWDQGFSSNYFARLTKATIHPDAQSKLAAYKIEQTLNAELLGFSSSSAICDNLNIPLLPFQENDALAKRYAVTFSDDLTAQGNIDIPDVKEAVQLAAISMAVAFGEEMPSSVSEMVEGSVIDFIPPDWRVTKSPEQWAELILHHRDDLIYVEPDDLQEQFLTIVQKSGAYGSHWFYAHKLEPQSYNGIPPVIQKLPYDLLLAFNSEGIQSTLIYFEIMC